MRAEKIITFLVFLLYCTGCSGQPVPAIAGTGVVSYVNVTQLGVQKVRNPNETDVEKYQRWLQIKKAFEYARLNKKNLLFPKGTYDVGERNFPFREENLKTNVLLDCGGITISGEGRGTILKTSSKGGADVLQLNMLKNITIKNFDITADLYSRQGGGSNGISVTNGYDNIVLYNIYIYDMPGVIKKDHIDGGKGLTIQFSPNLPTKKGRLKATSIKVYNCAYGFSFHAVHISELLKEKVEVEIDLVAEKAYQGFALDFGEASENVKKPNNLNIKANVSLKNCQQFVRLGRAIGGVYHFILNKTEGRKEIRTNNKGENWSNDPLIFGFLSNYSKNTNVTVSGNVGAVDHKIWIGAVGSITEPYNLKNRSENNIYTFDIEGTSKYEDIKIINYQNESVHNSVINLSKRTLNRGAVPRELKQNNNSLNISND